MFSSWMGFIMQTWRRVTSFFRAVINAVINGQRVETLSAGQDQTVLLHQSKCHWDKVERNKSQGSLTDLQGTFQHVTLLFISRENKVCSSNLLSSSQIPSKQDHHYTNHFFFCFSLLNKTSLPWETVKVSRFQWKDLFSLTRMICDTLSPSYSVSKEVLDPN